MRDLQHGGGWSADRENCQFVATQYDRAAQCINWTGGQAMDGTTATKTR
jgi:hypothetical protein